ncbi:MAG: VOC family protein [Thermoleophilia bacterium]|nr:VOC family protein [Thermoleophilia bacterium]
MGVDRLHALGLQIDQIGIVVPDLEGSVPAYAKGFGIDLWQSWTYDGAVMRTSTYRGEAGGFAMKLALGGAGPQIELIESITGPNVYTEHLERHGFGIHHVGCRVDDLAAGIEQSGYPVLQSGVGYGRDGTGGFAYLDTEKELRMIVELIEVPKERMEPEREWSFA